MANPRSSIKEKHERYQIALLISELNRRHRSSFKVISEPDPPEAIIKSGRTTRWAEVVTAYWNGAYARHLNSHATPDETPIPVGNGPFMDMDREFASNFVSTVKSKLEKKGYLQFKEVYGSGYLVVSIQHPFLDGSTFRDINEEWASTQINDLGFFRSIYITFRQQKGYKVVRWKPPC